MTLREAMERMERRVARERACIRCGAIGFRHSKARVTVPDDDWRKPTSLSRPHWLGGWPLCSPCLEEIGDHLRSETREACAQICDERARNASDAHSDISGDDKEYVLDKLSTRFDEASDCAFAIRAGGKP